MVPLRVYSAIIIQYNSYCEYMFMLHYINNTLESIRRGESLVYT
jgi:hypothetical protein